ncbi:hypothetical protein F5X71_33085 [Nocardia brasiliensis]|uniref:PPE domain-containing protein n=1 Tax=Nocardia brasiliensis TaxID=37326 RepID=A0A6G9XZZ5_NOCBR|nr:hypothetical protein [Nocardia brasiliensis]QIS06494.1 hypothetical protein F5X71_33085 [Nocardia brasiliensis]
MADSAAKATAAHIRQELAGLRTGATDPAYAPDRELFGSFTHQEIWELVREPLNPAALGQVAAAWQANASALAEAFQAFSDAVNREFARWSGHTADAALRATREFVRTGIDAQEVCRAVARLMELNSDAAQTIRDAIAPPEPYRPLDDPAAEVVYGGKRRMAHDSAAADLEADVRDTMTYVYTPTMPASGDRVPRFPAPPDGARRAGDGGAAR